MKVPYPLGESVDVTFPLDAEALPRDHAQALQQAICERLPWLDAAPFCGIHPVKVVQGLDEFALLPRRARLLIRIDRQRFDDLKGLANSELSVGGHPLHLGAPQLRELEPHTTLYAYRVAADSDDEQAFMASISAELVELSIGGERVCGKRQALRIANVPTNTFSLMLHQLSVEQSLRLQRCGLGQHRLLGCGVFVPHKSAAAV